MSKHLWSICMSLYISFGGWGCFEGGSAPRWGVQGWYTDPRALLEQSESLEGVMKQYLIDEEERIEKLQMVVNRMKNRCLSGSCKTTKFADYTRPSRKDIEEFLVHPINAFSIIESWRKIKKLTSQTSQRPWGDLLHAFSGHEVKLPFKATERTWLNNLLQLQIIYDIPTENMATGNIRGEAPWRPLAPDDMVSLAQQAQVMGYQLLAADWLAHALLASESNCLSEIDGIIDTLLEKLNNLVSSKLISTPVLLELERWIYVYNRDPEERVAVAQMLADNISWKREKEMHVTSSLQQFTTCAQPVQLEDLPAGVHGVQDLLSDTQVVTVQQLARSLYRMSFELEGMSQGVDPAHLMQEQRDIVEDIMTTVTPVIQTTFPELNINTVKHKDMYRFTVKYQSAANSGFSYSIRALQDTYESINYFRSSGYHILLSASEATNASTLILSPSQSAIRLQKGSAVLWYTDIDHSADIVPTYCPLITGQGYVVHIHMKNTN